MTPTKHWLNIASGITGFSVTFIFGIWLLWQPDSQNLNVTSWVLWTLMDSVLVALAIRGGNKRPFLFIGWTVAAALVSVSALINGATWKLGFAEWVSIAGVAVAICFWLKNNSGYGLYACAIALFLAGVPQISDFWDVPATGTWWLWVGTAIACTLSILGSAKWANASNVPTLSSLVYQIVVLAVLFL